MSLATINPDCFQLLAQFLGITELTRVFCRLSKDWQHRIARGFGSFDTLLIANSPVVRRPTIRAANTNIVWIHKIRKLETLTLSISKENPRAMVHCFLKTHKVSRAFLSNIRALYVDACAPICDPVIAKQFITNRIVVATLREISLRIDNSNGWQDHYRVCGLLKILQARTTKIMSLKIECVGFLPWGVETIPFQNKLELIAAKMVMISNYPGIIDISHLKNPTNGECALLVLHNVSPLRLVANEVVNVTGLLLIGEKLPSATHGLMLTVKFCAQPSFNESEICPDFSQWYSRESVWINVGRRKPENVLRMANDFQTHFFKIFMDLDSLQRILASTFADWFRS